MNKQNVLLWMLASTAIYFAACQEELPEGLSDESLETSLFAENVFSQLSADVDDAAYFQMVPYGRHGGKPGRFGFRNCMTVTEDSTSEAEFPRSVTMTYGDSCQSHGVTKSGSIMITLTADPQEAGSQRIVTFDNFMVNGYAIEGTQTYTNNGSGAYTEVLENGQITTPEGEVLSLTMQRTREIIEGQDTEEREDDVYQITGSTIITGEDGTSASKTITQPLIAPRSCFWITSGTIETVNGDTTTVIDFGDGTCDDQATRTENGETEEITMDFRMKKHQHPRSSEGRN